MHRSAQVALLALLTGIGIAVSPVAAQTNPPQPPAAPAASATNCPAVPALPPMPDGAHATRAQMDAYNGTYQQWSTAASTAKECRHNAAAPMRDRASALIQEFNAANTRINAINTYWTAWVNQLNGQPADQSQTCQRQHDIVAGEFHDRCEQQQGEASTAAPAAPDASTLGSGPIVPANSTSQCAAIPEPARPPDVEHMNASQKRRQVPPAVDAFNAWYTAARASLVCRHDEAQTLGTQADALVNEYNTTTQLVASSAQQWHAEVAEFNARTGHH